MHAFDRRTDRQTDRRTDRQTDRNLIVRPRLHSMQRGKKGKDEEVNGQGGRGVPGPTREADNKN